MISDNLVAIAVGAWMRRVNRVVAALIGLAGKLSLSSF